MLMSDYKSIQQDIEKIIKDGVQAPSGENCQPWRFKIHNAKVSLYNIPEADLSLYNSKQKGSYMAHGALIENMIISAEKHGYAMEITLFPHDHDEILVADIIFSKKEKANQEPLYDVIYKRCTNRKDYTGETLTHEQKKKLQDSVERLGFSTLSIVDDSKHMQSLGVALATNERVLFENKKLHNFFYDHILWNKKDEDKAGGFYIDTLEFLPHQLKGVKLFKNWIVLRMLNKALKVSKMISKENGEKYTKSGTFGALIMKGTTHKDYVNLGRSLQRLWLTATLLDIAMHPCNGTIYLMGHINDHSTGDFSGEHVAMLQKSYSDIVAAFDAGESHIGFIFRMGKAPEPTAIAKRVAPRIEYNTT